MSDSKKSFIKSIGPIKILVKNPSVTAEMLEDDTCLGTFYHRSTNQPMFIDTSEEFYKLTSTYFQQKVRISEFVRKHILSLLATDDDKKDPAFTERQRDFTLIVFQPLNGSPIDDSVGPDALAFQFSYNVNGLVILRHNDICFHCKKRSKRTDLRNCSGCGIPNYCDKECQKHDWKVHKGLCKLASKVKSETGDAIYK